MGPPINELRADTPSSHCRERQRQHPVTARLGVAWAATRRWTLTRIHFCLERVLVFNPHL